MLKTFGSALLLLTLSLLASAQTAESDCPTSGPNFTIQGFGSAVTGGCKGGQVVRTVNSLNDVDDGTCNGTHCSLREAATLSSGGAPILVKFSVSGWITLTSTLEINTNDITINGIDAPNKGVGVRGKLTLLGGDDMIIRHVRFRHGVDASNDDTIQINGGKNIVFDHLSIGWAMDENINMTGQSPNHPENITVQYCIIHEGLDSRFGILINQNSTNITLHHNVWTQNEDRMPAMSSNGLIEVISNVMNNGGFFATLTNQNTGSPDTRVDFIKNRGIFGVDSGGVDHFVTSGDAAQDAAEIYQTGNVFDGTNILNPNPSCPPGVGCWEVGTRRNPSPNVTEHAAADLINPASPNYLLNIVGARAGSCRDDTDTRTMNDVLNGTGTWIDDENDVGGFADLDEACAGVGVPVLLTGKVKLSGKIKIQ